MPDAWPFDRSGRRCSGLPHAGTGGIFRGGVSDPMPLRLGNRWLPHPGARAMSIEIQGTGRAGLRAGSRRLRRCVRRHPTMAQRLISGERGNGCRSLGGRRRRAPVGRWTADPLGGCFLCTKGLMSILAARLVQEGRLAYHVPASRYWPDMLPRARASRPSPTCSRTAPASSGPAPGPHLRGPAGLGTRMVGMLEPAISALVPAHGLCLPRHHPWLAGGELVRRVTGLSPGQYFAPW